MPTILGKPACMQIWRPDSDCRPSDDLLGRYSGPEVRTWEVSEPETFSMVGIILSQKMYPILCPPYRHIRTVVQQPATCYGLY